MGVPNPVRRVIVIAASPRTGSNLLCSALPRSGAAGNPHEYLNFGLLTELLDGAGWLDLTVRGVVGRVRRRLRGDADWRRTHQNRLNRRAAFRLLRSIAVTGTSADGVLSIKLMWDHYEFMLRHGVHASFWGAPVDWVFVCRQDRLRQAVSWCRASQTQQWLATSASQGEPVYDRATIERLIERGDRYESEWRGYFSEQGIRPFEVTYEQFDDRYEETVSAVFDYLNLTGAVVGPRALERQSDDLNDEWIERFRLDVAQADGGFGSPAAS